MKALLAICGRQPMVGTTALALTAALLASPALAVTTVNSGAYGLYVNLNVTPALNVGIAPVAAVSNTAAPAYSDMVQVASVNQSLGLGSSLGLAFSQGVSTGILTSTASSPYPVMSLGDATAVVNNLALNLTSKASLLPAITILGIGARTITSGSSVEGVGLPSATGTSTLTGLTISGTALGAVTINGSLFANPAPNTTLLNLLGLKIVLNEQIPSGDGLVSAGIATNALHVMFTNFLLGTRLLSGDIIVSHSNAFIDGVTAPPPPPPPPPPSPTPEPATWLQMIIGFGFIGALLRRRQLAAA